MKTKTLLQTTWLTLVIILLFIPFSNSQIPIQGLDINHEGVACWDATGSGPEPVAYGHPHPYGWGSSLYYCASRDYDGIDNDPSAAMCHFLDNITGFPLFVQALADNGFTADQVKIKSGLSIMKDDMEGEDWFTFKDIHYINRYNAYYNIELNGESLISGYMNYLFTFINSTGNSWYSKSNYSNPFDASEFSSSPVQAVAEAFLNDMEGLELRFVFDNVTTVGFFSGNGRVDGAYFNINSGYLEKGLPELAYIGPASEHQGIACWDADGTGPEPEKSGHIVNYGGTDFEYSYYYASRDYDAIDPDPNAALCYLTGEFGDFPNLKVQLEYLGFTADQLKVKSSISTLGNDEEGIDWGLDGSIHWWQSYGNTVTLEIAGEPILKYVLDTNFSFDDLSVVTNWWSYTPYVSVVDVSSEASEDAQHVAASFLKDLGGHSIKSYMEGHYTGTFPYANGRNGVYQTITTANSTAKLPAGRLIWGNEIKGTLFLDQSPYVFMDYCEIPDGETLVIEPGVVVKFNSTERFDINGCIVAEGTEQLPILFTAYDHNVPWGGMYWAQTPTTNDTSKLKHCILEYAYAYGTGYGYNCGGAIGIDQVEEIKISHCIFRYNSADKFTDNNPAGGAIFVNASSIHISHCIFHDNSSSWGGALVLGTNSSSVVDNCLFYNNESTYVGGGGGAVLVWTDCTPHFVNCTFADNHAANAGGAVELELGGETSFTNCIFWGNTADIGADQISIWMEDPPSLNVYYSDVEDGIDGITLGFQGEYLFNIEDDPEFMGPGEEHPYGLNGSSTCINNGILDPIYLPADWTCPAYCLCGNVRVYGSAIDLGSYESLVTGYNEDEIQKSSSINVFPNPINSNPVIEFYLENNGPVQISITDIHGKLVSEIYVTDLQIGQNQLSLSTDEISAGVYFCTLKNNNKVKTIKIIKH